MNNKTNNIDEERLSELLLLWEETLESGSEATAESLCREHPHLKERLQEQIHRLSAIQPLLATEDCANHDTDEYSGTVHRDGFPDAVSTSSDFRVVSHLATGGHGQIHIANDNNLGRDVAIKSLRPEFGTGSSSSQRLKREAEITGRLNHPGIVPVYSAGHDENGRPFYSMQLVSGETLRKAVGDFHAPVNADQSQQRLGFLKLIQHFVNVCETIAFAHAQNVIHRDIKPDNILLGKFGETFVVDWGLATVAAESTAMPDQGNLVCESSSYGRVMGTQGYMSPEQLRGQSAGKASDIFNLGATLYTILTGHKPYHLEPYEKNIDAVISGIPSPRKLNRTVAPALASICMKSMALRPGQRYAEVKDLAEDLQRWLADEPVSVHRETILQRVSRWSRRHKYLAIAAGIVLLVATGAFATSTFMINQEKNKTAAAGDVAQKNYELAKSAVDELFLEFSQNKLLNQPGTHSLRMDLLHKSLEYYQQFLEEQGDDDELMSEIADANERVAFIVSQVGSQEDALKHLDKAIAIRQRLYVEKSTPQKALKLADALSRKADHSLNQGDVQSACEQLDSAVDLVTTARASDNKLAGLDRLFVYLLVQLGSLHYSNGEYDQAIAKNQEALARCQALQGEGGDAKVNQFVSTILTNIGNGYRMMGSRDSALQSYQQAVVEFEKLIEANPEVIQYRADLANTLNQIGGIYVIRDNVDAAQDALERSILELQEVTKVESDVNDYQRMLADAYTTLGRLLIPTNKLRSKELITLAAKIRKQLVLANPDDVGLRFNDAAANCSLAKLALAEQRFEESVDHFKYAIAVFRDLDQLMPGDPQVRVRGLACTLQALGEAQAANGDHGNAASVRRESLEIFQNHHREVSTVETELKMTRLALELAESLRATDQRIQSLQLLKDRARQLADSPVIDGPINGERRQLGVEVGRLATTLLEYYDDQQQLAANTRKISQRLGSAEIEGEGQGGGARPSNKDIR